MTNLIKKDKQLDNSTDKKEFKPTPHMIVWLDTAIKTGSDVIDEIGRESGIDESSWYNWLKKDGFIEWYEAEWNNKIRSWGWKLDAIGMKNAKRDFNYWKSMQNRTGRLNENKGTNIQVNNIMPIMGEKKAE